MHTIINSLFDFIYDQIEVHELLVEAIKFVSEEVVEHLVRKGHLASIMPRDHTFLFDRRAEQIV